MSDAKKVVMVARDAAPSRAFMKLEKVLQEQGFSPLLFVGDGKPIENVKDMINSVSGSRLILLGMSSSKDLAMPEIEAGRAAVECDVPFGFYGDIRRCWARARKDAWFEELAWKASFYMGATQADAKAAREVFPNASLIGTGNPLREDMAFPELTREQSREKLGVMPEEKLVLVAGGKLSGANFFTWISTLEAMSLLKMKSQVIFSVHPGDLAPGAFIEIKEVKKELKLYEEIIQFSTAPTKIVGKNIMATSSIVPGADVVVEFGSSIGIEGAYQCIPVITFSFDVLANRNKSIAGVAITEAVDEGLSELVVGDPSALASAISRLLTPVGYAQLRSRQQETCVKPPERGAALKNMAQAIENVISQRHI